MIELYDNQVSTSAQKVRLVLAEKGVEYKSHMLNLQAGEQFTPEFRKANPSCQVPALVHDGEIYTESTVICEYLDDVFPEPSLKPATARERARMRWWTEQSLSWCITMINNINVAVVFAPMIKAQKTPEELEAQINQVPNPTQRARQAMLYEQEAASPLVANAIRRYHGLIGQIDDAVQQGGPWLTGETFTLADTGLFPYVNRLHNMEWDTLWQGRDAYLDWYNRVKARPSFKAAIEDIVPPPAIEFAKKCAREAQPILQETFDTL